jgi:hypothetical protein
MGTTLKPVRVPADSELSEALRNAAATGASVIVETGDASYFLDVEAQSPPSVEITHRSPSPDEIARSIAGIERATGAWVGLVDAEELTAYIRERRRASGRPPVEL